MSNATDISNFGEAYRPEIIECPSCHAKSKNRAAIRQGPGFVDGVECHVIRIGFRCTICGFEWGFEDGE